MGYDKEINWKLVAGTAVLVAMVLLVAIFKDVREVLGTFLIAFPLYLGIWCAYILTKLDYKLHIPPKLWNIFTLLYFVGAGITASWVWQAFALGAATVAIYYILFFLAALISRGINLFELDDKQTGEG